MHRIQATCRMPNFQRLNSPVDHRWPPFPHAAGVLVRLGLLALMLTGTALGQTTTAARREKALVTLRRAAEYYHNQVAVHGGYVYFYTPDLKTRWGEGLAGPQQIWVQPPATPTVGLAFVTAYRTTGDSLYRQAAQDAAEALVYGQLESGGWTNSIDFDRQSGDVAQYRGGRGRGRNYSTLDDGISQAALECLARTDEMLDFKHAAIHEAAEYGLAAILKAQFAIGGFPQVWSGPVEFRPIKQAKFPPYDWRTEGRIKEYWLHYTLNDDLASKLTRTLLTAHQVYKQPRYLASAKKLGDFLLLAQMPDPQPGWAQQYNSEMQPIWARAFEPAALAGRESQDAIRTLLVLYRQTGDNRYLEPLPRALAWLEKSLLPDGRLARYYELRTNKPLYMQRDGKKYELTYDDTRLPDHYGWKTESALEELRREVTAAADGQRLSQEVPLVQLAAEVDQIVASLDSQGRWLSRYAGQRLVGQPKFAPDAEYLSSELFSRNVETLCQYLQATK